MNALIDAIQRTVAGERVPKHVIALDHSPARILDGRANGLSSVFREGLNQPGPSPPIRMLRTPALRVPRSSAKIAPEHHGLSKREGGRDLSKIDDGEHELVT